MARRQGQAAHSPELTAAGGWLTAVILLGALSDKLTIGFAGLVRGTFGGSSVLTADAALVVAQVRELVFGLAWPLAAIVSGFAAGATAAHQLQVRGLWATQLIVPDLRRLWAFSAGPGLAVRVERLTWSLVKALVLMAASAWMIRAAWYDLVRQSGLEGPLLAHLAGRSLLRMGRVLAAVLLALGSIDYSLRYRRFEAMLRATPQQHREDQQVMEGDAAARAQRRRVARSWRGDRAELLAGASLLLCGSGGLTLVLAGGPPPRRVTVRSIVQGNAGLRLRRSSEASQITQVNALELARRLARRPAPGSAISTELIAALAAIWPADIVTQRAMG
jgi:flagellar biosynthetic protein FlhB